jgi:hypothetical protein
MAAKTWKAQKMLSQAEFRFALGGSFVDFSPIEQLLAERQRLHAQRLNDYAFLFEQSAKGVMTIGRRGQDVVRELTLTTLERSMIEGEPALLHRDKLRTAMIKAGRPELARSIEAGLDPAAELMQSIPLFHKDGKPHFYLKTKTGAYMAFSVDSYVDLVSTTTSEEADRMAQPEKARALGTRLVKFNKTGKGKAFYLATNDERCAAVDGEVFSIEETGTLVNGTLYQYWREALPGPYVTCHPYCQHFMRPFAEALA